MAPMGQSYPAGVHAPTYPTAVPGTAFPAGYAPGAPMAYNPAAYNPAAYLPLNTGPPQFQLPSQGANDIQLEIVLRSNLLQRQQKRIEVLESALTETCTEITNLKSNTQDIETRVKDTGTANGGTSSGSGGAGSGAGGGGMQGVGSDKQKSQSRYWTTEEHNNFLKGLERFGTRDFKATHEADP